MLDYMGEEQDQGQYQPNQNQFQNFSGNSVATPPIQQPLQHNLQQVHEQRYGDQQELNSLTLAQRRAVLARGDTGAPPRLPDATQAARLPGPTQVARLPGGTQVARPLGQEGGAASTQALGPVSLKRPASGKLPLLGPKRRATALAVPKPKVEEDQQRATGPGADFNAQNIFRVQEDQQNPKMLKDQMLEDQIREDQMRKEEHRMREEQMREDEMLENEMLEDQRRQDQRRAAALREQEPKSCSTSRTEAQDAGESTESDDAGGSVESDDAGGSVESDDVGGLVESDDAGGSVESDDTGGSVESDDTGGSVESDDAGRSREVFHSSRICAKKEDEEGYPAANPHIAPTN
eukprot:gene31838-7044_t